ncbi:MAG: TetR/AcrR family transcriptional regulator [Anaerovoracaceae bacterium]|jgi:AcrR family transcriptional regulator
MDKRVIKTKKGLKEALIKLMNEKPFAKISVTELCAEANTSRITFYTYYGDKYELLQELFADISDQTRERFEELQKENNEENDAVPSFRNFFDAVVDIESHYITSEEYLLKNSDLVTSYYQFLVSHLDAFEIEYQDQLRPKYPKDQLNAFFAVGFWGFIHASGGRFINEKNREDARNLVTDLLNSDIFIHTDKAD